MTQVVQYNTLQLENSMFRDRPHLNAFMRPDPNVGETDMTEYIQKKHHQELHIPNATGAPDYTITCDINDYPTDPSVPQFAKKRTDLRIIDPITGFVSAAGEVLLNNQKFQLPTFGKARIEPQTSIPNSIHSIRSGSQAIDEIKRIQEGSTDPQLKFDTHKVLDIVLKSRLGGWTSKKDPRTTLQREKTTPYGLREIYPNMELPYKTDAERDELSKRYQYSTSTHDSYSQVNWDSKVPNKLHAPVTTLEPRADPLKFEQQTTTRPHIWQTVAGSTWDRHQARYGHYSTQKVSFTAPNVKGNHLPGYSGHIGGKMMEYKDDVLVQFQPHTVLRTVLPKEPDANFKPNIPGYTGHTHQFKTRSVSHYDNTGRPYTTTAAYHRLMPEVNQMMPNDITSLSGDFARIQTKVSPQNPYDNIKRSVDLGANHSMDHVSQPIVNSKFSNHADFLLANQDDRLKSILKK